MFFPAPSISLPFIPAIRLVLAPSLVALLLGACGQARNEDAVPLNETLGAVEVPAEASIRVAPLTGEVVDEERSSAIAGRRPLAVMVDNIAAATPQAGLDQADVVIEALVEGGVTRYMAIFQSNEPAVIEPVRSARTPFLYWASEYDALYVHVGSAEKDGPADAGQQIHDWGIYALDLGTQPFDHSYVRDPARKAPHNVLITPHEMRRKAAELGLEGPASVAPWTFSSPEGLWPGVLAPSFTVRFGVLSPRFSAHWAWDQNSLLYLRSQFGAPQYDATSGNRLAFANVIVQYADAYVADSNGHVLIDVIGEGRAQVFNNGQLIEGTWRKADRRARTEFIGTDGSPIPLLAGSTWIEVVQPTGGGAFLE